MIRLPTSMIIVSESKAMHREMMCEKIAHYIDADQAMVANVNKTTA